MSARRAVRRVPWAKHRDTADNRVLLWEDLPAGGRPAEAVLGRPSFAANGENRWAVVEHDTLR